MKIPYHKIIILAILILGGTTLLLGIGLTEGSNTIFDWIGFVSALVMTLYFLSFWHLTKNDKELKTYVAEDIDIEFKEHEIAFTNGYYYKYSKVHSSKIIAAEQIGEINSDRTPSSIVINDNEVIFIPSIFRDLLEDFGGRNNIPIIHRFDIWTAINKPLLGKKNDSDNIQTVVQNGLSKEDVLKIRKKIKFSGFFSRFIAWDMEELSHFYHLKRTWPSKKKYWESMEIALRNYQKHTD